MVVSGKVNLNVIGLPSEIHVHESFMVLSSAGSIALRMPVSDGWSVLEYLNIWVD